MTMISGYKLKGGGFLQADILLTSPDKWARSWPVPSFHANDDSPALDAHIVAGLCQKILVVNERFAVAFAGDVPAIQAVVRLIDQLIHQHPVLTSKRFSDAVLADKTINKAEIEIIALSVEGDEIRISNVYAEYAFDNEHFELWVGGSGAKHAIKHYQDYPPEAFDVPEEDIVAKGTCMALHQFAKHLIGEYEKKFQSETITDLFGGGYEVLAFFDGKFQKISDVVYAFADAEFDSEGQLQIDFPKCLIKSAYEGEDLKIRSVGIYYDEDEEEYMPQHDRTFTIAPISCYRKTKVADNLNGQSFMGRFLCFLIKVKVMGDEIIIPIIRRYDRDLYFLCKAFSATVNPDSVQIIYSDKFREDVRAEVLKFFGV